KSHPSMAIFIPYLGSGNEMPDPSQHLAILKPYAEEERELLSFVTVDSFRLAWLLSSPPIEISTILRFKQWQEHSRDRKNSRKGSAGETKRRQAAGETEIGPESLRTTALSAQPDMVRDCKPNLPVQQMSTR